MSIMKQAEIMMWIFISASVLYLSVSVYCVHYVVVKLRNIIAVF